MPTHGVSGEFRRVVRAAGVDAEDVDDTAVRRIFLYIDRDGSGTVELAEMLEVLTGPVLETDDPITRMILLHKGARWEDAGPSALRAAPLAHSCCSKRPICSLSIRLLVCMIDRD